jgi:hypothetical protein
LDLSKIPNEKLGTCLDKKWIQEMEAKYQIDHTERDPRHHFHLKHPFLQEAIKKPRFFVSILVFLSSSPPRLTSHLDVDIFLFFFRWMIQEQQKHMFLGHVPLMKQQHLDMVQSIRQALPPLKEEKSIVLSY